ncbi:MAG TPA: response regulator [Thermoleophilia bacterium]|nr:response regulator [Acidobacteriota bacterium]HOU29006.1 response regulator [Thermoleophilia bacterium]HQJ27709.1 response regulator [Thermoleophilia bacterium]
MRVLIAHASSKAREALTRVVKKGIAQRVDIMTSDQGGETLDLLLQDDPPEVALVDWDLPEIEGPEMCRLVRDFHHGHDTYIVVLAAATHTDTIDAWRAGAADCITTPATAKVMRAAVEKGLRVMAARGIGGPLDDEATDGDGRGTLEAIRTAAGDDLGWGPAELRTTMTSDLDPAWRPGGVRPDTSTGAALLQALLNER